MAGFIDGILALDSSVFVTSSGNNNDVPCDSSLMYIVVSNDMDTITGIALGQTIGGLILVVNTGPTNNLILKNNSSSSAAANVIISANGSDYVVGPYNTAILGYDTTNLMWHIVRVPDSVPPGSIQMWGAATAPVNWLLCNGTSYLRTDYPALFGAIGTTYGTIDGTHFTMPDMRQKFPLGLASSGTGSTLATSGGTIDHIHTVDPPITTSSGPSATVTGISLLGIGGAASQTHTHTTDISSFNSGTANPPYLVVNYIIKI